MLLAELEKNHSSTSTEALGSVFSALLLLALLGTSDNSPPQMELVDPFLPYVEACLQSSVWKVGHWAFERTHALTELFTRCETLPQSQ